MFEVKKEKAVVFKKIEYPKSYVKVSQKVFVNGEGFIVSGEGYAKCDTGDKFNQEFGYQLARTRAELDRLKGYEAFLVSVTKQSGWRKESKFKGTGFHNIPDANMSFRIQNMTDIPKGRKIVEINGGIYELKLYYPDSKE